MLPHPFKAASKQACCTPQFAHAWHVSAHSGLPSHTPADLRPQHTPAHAAGQLSGTKTALSSAGHAALHPEYKQSDLPYLKGPGSPQAPELAPQSLCQGLPRGRPSAMTGPLLPASSKLALQGAVKAVHLFLAQSDIDESYLGSCIDEHSCLWPRYQHAWTHCYLVLHPVTAAHHVLEWLPATGAVSRQARCCLACWQPSWNPKLTSQPCVCARACPAALWSSAWGAHSPWHPS